MAPPLRALLLASFLVISAGCGGTVGRVGDLPSTGGEPDTNGESRRRLGGWEELRDGLPEGGQVLGFAHLDDSAFALVEAGGQRQLFSLRDSAVRWEEQPLSLGAGEVPQSLTRVDRSLYLTAANVGAGTGSLHRLDFADDPWVHLTHAPAMAPSAVVKRGEEVLVAFAGAEPGLYATSDRGRSWSLKTAAQGGAAFLAHPVKAFVASPGSLRFFAVGDPAHGQGGLFLSDDMGGTWFQDEDLAGDVSALHARESWVLVELSGKGALRSDNYGNIWHPMDLKGQSARSFWVSSADGAFAGTSGGVFLTLDGGRSWEPTSGGPMEGLAIDRLYLAGGSMFAASGSRVFAAPME